MSISQNLNTLNHNINGEVKLVVVSKTRPENDILEAYNYGQRTFGENKPKEIVSKYNNLPKDIEWHYIGSLQRTNVKFIAPFVSLIHSVDSSKLLECINKEAIKNNRVIDVLMEIHVAQEDSKHGWNIEQLMEYLESGKYKDLLSVRICGIMAMATFTDNQTVVRDEFKKVKEVFNQIKNKYFYDIEYFKEISMGMSSDYKIAIEEGATMVRVGSVIFM